MARLDPVSEEDVAPEYREHLVSSLQGGKPLDLYGVMGNNPEVLAGMREYFGAMWSESGLTDRERELLILTVADEAGSEYEWHQHLNIAPEAGLTDAEISAIVTGDTGTLDERDALVVRYGRAAVRGAVDDELHARMAAAFDDDALVGAASVAGAYLGLARFIDAMGIEVED